MFYMLNNKSKPYSSSEGNFSGALCLAPKSPEDQPVLFGTIFPITAKEVEYVAISRIWTKCRIRMSQPSAGQFSPALVSCPCLMSGITITWISGRALTQCTTFLHNVQSSTTATIWCTRCRGEKSSKFGTTVMLMHCIYPLHRVAQLYAVDIDCVFVAVWQYSQSSFTMFGNTVN